MRMVRAELLAAGLANDAEIDAHLAAIDAGELDLTLAPPNAPPETPFRFRETFSPPDVASWADAAATN
ncbi:hypothetical protein ACIBO2_58360 [Nonomuraea sp. NPDC050022]|uniref:hypothetical protein n=1 Tax=unclassified Nonomuraea TaxID=2593643 RepID=UPI0033FD4ED3